jgi:SAM-dependent methyltransferase
MSVEGAATFRTSAQAYDRHVGRYAPPLAEALIAAAKLQPGQRALDVGCGPGALSAVLAARLGPRNVSAVDPSESFAAACRARLPDVDVRVGQAERLPFQSDSFDVVLAQLVVNFMSDPQAGLREMARVARPGGTIAACVWDYSGQMVMLRTFWDAASQLDPEEAPAFDEGRTMRFCREGELAELWNQNGLASVASRQLVVGADYTDFDDFWRPFLAGVAPSGAYCVSLDPARQGALYRECWRRRSARRSFPFDCTGLVRCWDQTDREHPPLNRSAAEDSRASVSARPGCW